MSIKGFHILFITVATLLCVFVVVWAFVLVRGASVGLQVFGGTCALAAILLPVYGVRFYQKVEKI